MKYKFYKVGISLILLSVLTACANMPLQQLTPKVRLTDFRVMKLGLTEQSYKLKLSLNNPNPFPLPLIGMDYKLLLNDKEFTQGSTNQPLTIAALGEQTIEINVVSNLMKIIGEWHDISSVFNRQLNYRLLGNMNVVNSEFKIPFEYRGDIPISNGE
jgi:LEA14-like dessication related protein